MPQVGLLAAFMAGLLSFLSPCILPLIPAYISFIVGISAEELECYPGCDEATKEKEFFKIIINCLLFVVGFSCIFIIMGASATAIGGFMLTKKRILGKVAGVVIILLGLHLTHIWRIKALDYEKKIHLKNKPAGAIGSLVVGMAFALGWTPCIGPILASILAYAATQETTSYGMLLLGFYSLGLGIPFILTGLSINSFFLWFDRIKKHLLLVERISGVCLILVGVLMLTDNFQRLVRFFSFVGY
jgi:cytochrome c-type biogenesis protein